MGNWVWGRTEEVPLLTEGVQPEEQVLWEKGYVFGFDSVEAEVLLRYPIGIFSNFFMSVYFGTRE